MKASKKRIQFPDDLVTLWKWFNQIFIPNKTEDSLGELYLELHAELVEALMTLKMPGMTAESVTDLVTDYLITADNWNVGSPSEAGKEVSEPTKKNLDYADLPTDEEAVPENEAKPKKNSGHVGLLRQPLEFMKIKAAHKSYLVLDLKKLAAQRNNPVGYEIDSQLRAAIRVLEKSGEIQCNRGDSKRIGELTSLKLASAPNREATQNDYEGKRQVIRDIYTKKRGDTYENSCAITLEDAKLLVEQLLKAFNGWVTFRQLEKAAFEHTPNQFKILGALDVCPKSGNQNEGEVLDVIADASGQNPAPVFKNEKDEDREWEVFKKKQGDVIIKQNSEKVWDRVCKAAADDGAMFCLYFLPKQYNHFTTAKTPKKVLEDFGSHSTAYDRNKKLETIWKEEFEVFGCNHAEEYSPEIIPRLGTEILKKLVGRCTENNYNPYLNVDES